MAVTSSVAQVWLSYPEPPSCQELETLAFSEVFEEYFKNNTSKPWQGFFWGLGAAAWCLYSLTAQVDRFEEHLELGVAERCFLLILLFLLQLLANSTKIFPS